MVKFYFQNKCCPYDFYSFTCNLLNWHSERVIWCIRFCGVILCGTYNIMHNNLEQNLRFAMFQIPSTCFFLMVHYAWMEVKLLTVEIYITALFLHLLKVFLCLSFHSCQISMIFIIIYHGHLAEPTNFINILANY